MKQGAVIPETLATYLEGEVFVTRKHVFFCVLATQIVGGASLSAPPATPPWIDITPRTGLAKWHVAGGSARYEVVGGELVGHAAKNTPNSWLVSDQTYGDYILEYDAKTDPTLNSGMMIRGQSRPDYRNGVVHGYQAEIDPSPRAWSGGIYDEQRRQWLYALGRNDAARKAFRSGDWNHYRIEAIGNRLRTWVNGVPAGDVVDDMDARGFLAFQVHSVSDAVAARNPEVRFRNVKIITDRPARFASPATNIAQEGWLTNRLTAAETRAGWKLLWDGQTGNGWRGAKAGTTFPAKGWSIHDGMLTTEGGGGDVLTTRAYRNFELSVEFRLTPGANSGIKYRIDPAALNKDGTAIGLEYQLLDNDRHPDAKLGRDGNRKLGSLYDLIPATNLLDPANPGTRINPIGEWNRAVIVVRGNHVEHWLNGFKVVEFERGSSAFREAVAQSKFRDVPGFGTWAESPILLQDHGDKVDFRSIKIREF